MTAVDAIAILDSGSVITTIYPGIAQKLQAAFPDVQVVGGMSHPGKLKVADGRVLAVEKKTCPVRVALQTSWGLVTLDPFSFSVMPGDDDVVIFGNPTLKLLDIYVYDSLGARARKRAALTGVDTAAYRQCHGVTVSVEAPGKLKVVNSQELLLIQGDLTIVRHERRSPPSKRAQVGA